VGLRILIVNSTFYPRVVGGAELSTWVLARALSERGHRVDALATTGRLDEGPRQELAPRRLDGISGEILEAASGGRQHLLARAGEAQAGILTRGLHHFQQVHDRRWLGLALAAIDRTQPDVIHTNNIVGLSTAIWVAARRRGVPVLHTLRDYHLLCPRTTLQRSSGAECGGGPLPCQVLRGLKRRHTDGVSLVTAPSRFVLDRHAAFGFFRDIRREVVPNACEGDPAPYEPPPVDARGLYLGQLDVHKGVDVLLAALERALAREEGGWGFDIAGDGPLRDRVEAFCARHPDRVRYHGTVQGEAKRALLRGCSFVVAPSVWQEIFGRFLLDAYMHGRPVIASPRGGIPEVLRDGQTGRLVEPEPAALAAAMLGYAADRPRCEREGRAARQEADRYTAGRQVERFATLYEELQAASRVR
jgi:glycosyltransferase involved in cell wall biosynthesis